MWFANTDTETQKIWGSEVFVYDNFDKEESVEVEIPSNKLNPINSLVNGRDFTVVGTTVTYTQGSPALNQGEVIIFTYFY